MFKGKTDLKTFAAFIDGLLAVVGEAKLNVDETGIEVRAVDPANVAMVVGLYNREAFLDEVGEVEYQATPDVFGLDLKRFRNILRTRVSKTASNIGLELVEDGERRLQVEIDDGLKFTVQLLDPTSIRKEPRSFEKHFSACTTIDAGDFYEAIAMTAKMSDTIEFQADADTKFLTIRAESEEECRRRAAEFAFNSLQYDVGQASFMVGSPYDRSGSNPLNSLFYKYRKKACRDYCDERTGPATFPWEEMGMPLVRDDDDGLQLYLTVTEAMAHVTILDGPGHLSRSICAYSAEYLSKISRGLKSVAGQHGGVEFEMNRDYPARMSAGDDRASVSYLVAPRIVEE